LLLDLQRTVGNRTVVSAIEGRIAPLPVQRIMPAAEFEKNTRLFLRKGESAADFSRFTQSLARYEQMRNLPPAQRRSVLMALGYDLKQWLKNRGSKSSRSKPVRTLIEQVSAALSELDSRPSIDGGVIVYKNTNQPQATVYKNQPQATVYKNQAEIDAWEAAQKTNQPQATVYKNQAEIDALKSAPTTNVPRGTVAALISAWGQGGEIGKDESSVSAGDEEAFTFGPTKYAKLKKLQPMYAKEFTAGSTDLVSILKEGEDDVKAGKVASLEEYMMKQFGWSQEDCAKYLNPAAPQKPLVGTLGEKGRQVFELHGGNPVTQGASPEPFDTAQMFSKFMGAGYSIYVMDKSGRIFAAQHKVGLFHHSSFFAGGSVAGAGEMKVDHGTIKSITNKSGHYQPTAEEMMQVFNELQSRAISLDGLEYIPLGGSPGEPVTPSKLFSKNPYPGGAAKFVKDQAGT
jgi:hypothetical protein